nr:uncharacterized protein LOC111414899 [Onthophagus taurus]
MQFHHYYQKSCEKNAWCNQKCVENETSKKVFENMSKKYKSPSLWTFYSILRAVMSMKKNVEYTQLVVLLKRQGKMYKPKKSKVLSKTNIEKFLKEADDVVLIIGIAGTYRNQELVNLVLGDVKDDGQVFYINIPMFRRKKTTFRVNFI